ncbi:MAG: hypothetical protein V7642_3170 [Burkholderiales bacterium]|jgi:hypothetical protein
MSTPDNSDFVRATRRGRVLSTLLLAVAIALLALFQFLVLPFISASLNANPTPQSIASLKYLFLAFAALAILPAIAMIASGRKILKCGQTPVPGAWVWRDTRVKHGRDAARIAWICIAAGAFACLLCTAMVAFIWTTFDRIVPENGMSGLRPGVIILEQRPAAK